jgi:hypothetical protein
MNPKQAADFSIYKIYKEMPLSGLQTVSKGEIDLVYPIKLDYRFFLSINFKFKQGSSFYQNNISIASKI